MMTTATTPTCPKCKSILPHELLNHGAFTPCPQCNAPAWVEAFPTFGRTPPKGVAAELTVGGEEARCFYHESRKAAEICEICGRFLCALCDCALKGKHYCPGCLEAGRSSGRIEELDTSRTLYGRQAFWLSILPFFISGIIAVYIALRYRNAPASIVNPQRWMIPTALILGLLQTIAFTVLIVSAAMS